MGPAETQNAEGMAYVLELGAEICDGSGDRLAPVALVLETYCRNSAGKHQCLELFASHGIELPDTPALLAQARQGNAEAFCQLVQPLEARLLRQAVALCRNTSTAEDIVSETLVQAWKSLAAYNETCRLSTWLYAILLHRHQKSLRAARSRPISLAWLPFADAMKHCDAHQVLPAAEASPAGAVAQAELAAGLRRAVELLPEKHRQVVLLRFFEEASLEEIATVLACSVGTVKSRLHHALEKLRRMKNAVNLSEWRRDT
jgi:RNA polymerase sigma-70 factor (ECF subfamily)